MSRWFPLTILALAAAFAAVAPAQSQPLQVQVTANGATTTIGPSASLSITSSGTGQTVFANVSVTNISTSAVTITGISVTGSSDMTLVQTSTLPTSTNPVSLTPNGSQNDSLGFSVQYSPSTVPSTGVQDTAQVVISYTANATAATFSFFLTGVTPTFTYTYSLPSGNLTPLASGGVIAFPATTLGQSTTATVNVLNSGSGSGTLQTISVTGSGFQITGFSAPVTLTPGQPTTFYVTFTPLTSGAALASLVVGFSNGSASFSVTGTGTSPNFFVTYTLADGNAHALTSGTTINFPSVDINGTATAVINILNQGTGAGSVTGISVTGTGFRIASEPALPATVGAGLGGGFQFIFNPTQAGSFSGSFSITLGGNTISGALEGSTALPNFSLSYVDPATNNIVALQNGASLSFPNTLVNATSTITMIAANTGPGTGLLNSIALGGNSPSAFQILNQPLLPASVPPSQQVTFGVRFSPLQQQTFSAPLNINLNGQAVTVNLSAQGIGPQYAYTWSNTAGATTVTPSGTIPMGNVSVGQTSSIVISVTNMGIGNGQISALAVTAGQGLSITNAPAVPLTLIPNGSQTFTLSFAPTQPGPVTATLTIGTDTFIITATGAGSLLTYSYKNSASTISVAQGGVVIFQPTAVQSQSSITFSIQNKGGTSSAAISSINLAAASTIFSIQQQPSLPTNLNPDGSIITFSVNFVPNNVGTVTASLLVNDVSFTLSGTGTQPASLPSYQFQGPSGTEAAAQQPSVGLTLSAPYPLALQGVLTLTFTSAVFTDDPSIQFATGGRTVSFTVPANSTQAVFSGGSTSMPLQTGTTAGTILVTPSFATQNGFNMTPSSPATLTLTIPSAVAQLSSESVTSETLTSFTVILNGYSTSHSLTQLNIQINPKSGDTFSAGNLTVSVGSASSAWYQSTAAQPFGGGFLIAIPFVLSNGTSTSDLVHMLQSLTITATNSAGVSSSISVPIP